MTSPVLAGGFFRHGENGLNMNQELPVDHHLKRVYGATTKNELTEAYSQWAHDYDSQLGALGWGAPVEAAQRLAKFAPLDGQTLDVGAGTGLVGEALKAEGFKHVTALDLSPSMLAVAEKKNVYQNYVQADLEARLPIEDETFDGVVGVGVFTQGHSGPKAFEELVRITKTGGFLCYSLRPDLAIEYGYQAEADRLAAAGKWELAAESSDLPGFGAVQTKPYRIWVYRKK
jgi:ubiquinone/menaquinone biosynthesis C-methylase UbiE